MSPAHGPARTALITGGAGFVGCNVAADLLADGWRVRILDDLSRAGVRENLDWLLASYPDRVEPVVADLLDARRLELALAGVDAVYHFAAQVAVTTSLEDPAADFRVNLLGTFRLLEAIRALGRPAPLVFASTNKVYGDLAALPLREEPRRYVSPQLPAVDEGRALDFHTPYGCSKGGAEQYVLDYARSYAIPATVLRMSCIYGPRQFGTEDQGWVAHFLIRALEDEPIDVFGDGKQVRDILYVGDLVRAQRAALEHIDRLAGRAWNIGGGLANSVSLLEVLDLIADVTGERPAVRFRAPRAGDQRYYVSNCNAFAAVTGWAPGVAPAQGIAQLAAWLREHRLARAARAETVAGGR
ncbi:MAG TPA: NAD-dependent epimerase/dehydratase family protein [Pseudomonadales bacterium]